MPNKFSEVTPEIKELAKKCNKKIDEELFEKEVFVNVMVKVSLQD